MPTINSRLPSSPTWPTLYQSNHQLGDIVLFNPRPLVTGTTGMPAEVVRVSFDHGKVLYDLALEFDVGGTTEFYTSYPIRSVDSIFVTSRTQP